MSSETFLVDFNGNQAEFPTLHFALKKRTEKKKINYFEHFIGS